MHSTVSITECYDEPATMEQNDEPALEYRALHTGAIVGLVLGAVSVFVVITAASSLEECLMVIPIPLVGMFVSLRAWAQINRQSDQYTGKPLALGGLALSTIFLATGLSYGGYSYATEVPEGYTRISFGMFKPDELDLRSRKFTPDEIVALEGKKVFIKGYIRPDSLAVRKNAKQFLLVRDNNQCCFGDASKVKYYDQIAVAMQGKLNVDYSAGLFRMGGTLHIHPQSLGRGPDAPVFSLQADYVK